MLRIEQVKLSPEQGQAELTAYLCKRLKLTQDKFTYQIIKKSIDARKKDAIKFVYTIDLKINDRKQEKRLLKMKNIRKADCSSYCCPQSGSRHLKERPVIIGSGPAGLFCTLMLARKGYDPILLERGAAVEERQKDVEQFWKDGVLKPDSNVQFGEGGAGTFSDGKLNTLVKDISGRNRYVLEAFVAAGAPEDILYWNKPHIGTDILTKVIKNLRKEIEAYGGTVRFHSQLTDIKIVNGVVGEITINETEKLKTELLVLAVGHSARDTFQMLVDKKIPISPKSFAVGVRIEHPQEMIQQAMYGENYEAELPQADYKLSQTLANGRGVYSFCMCPGGYVVNAASEAGGLAVNGMSYHKRAGKNANSAIIVTVSPEDFKEQGPLAGVAFQRRLEEHAYHCGKGKVPIQLFGDFCKNQLTAELGAVTPMIKGAFAYGNLREILPGFVGESLAAGIKAFGTKITGFDREDAILSGVESRTSSPIRIWRNEGFESEIKGLFPCGEGAGYAGGIMSAAMDGLKVAEALIGRYAPFDQVR